MYIFFVEPKTAATMYIYNLALLVIAWITPSCVQGAKFGLYLEEATWEEAKANCQLVGRRLAHIDSAEDQRDVEKMQYYITEEFFWIGLYVNVTTQTAHWADDTRIANYTNWATGFPGYEEDLNCVRIRYLDFKWETSRCAGNIKYLCENTVYVTSDSVGIATKLKGLAMGLGIIGGIFFLSCLLLQLPCFRQNVSHKMAEIGFGTNSLDKKLILGDNNASM